MLPPFDLNMKAAEFFELFANILTGIYSASALNLYFICRLRGGF